MQLLIDWDVLNFRRMVEEVPLPEDCSGVSVEAARAVLLAIYDQSNGRRCWPGQDTIAKRAGVDPRHVRRAVDVLKRWGVLFTYRAKPIGGTSRLTLTHYVIEWTAIGSLLRQNPCPVDRDPCPVDRDPCPVDSCVDNISSRTEGNGKGKERKLTSTSSCSATVATRPPSSSRTDATESVEEVERAIAAELSAQGIGKWRSLIDRWRRECLLNAALLDEVREVCRVALHPANQSRFSSVQGAIVARLESGVWPVQGVVQDVDGWSTRDHARRTESDEKRWRKDVVSAAYDVRKRTPSGHQVDDGEVVRVAADVYGVPVDVAKRERGIA